MEEHRNFEDGNTHVGSAHDPGLSSPTRPSSQSEVPKETPVELFKHLVKSYDLPWTLLLLLPDFKFWRTLSTTKVKDGHYRTFGGCTCQPSYSGWATRTNVEVMSIGGPFFDLYCGLGYGNPFIPSYLNCRLQKGFYQMCQGEICCPDPTTMCGISVLTKCCSLGGQGSW